MWERLVGSSNFAGNRHCSRRGEVCETVNIFLENGRETLRYARDVGFSLQTSERLVEEKILKKFTERDRQTDRGVSTDRK